MKNTVVLVICLLIAAGSIAAAVYAFDKQNKLSKTLEEERYGRLVAEESSQKSAAKLAALENQVKTTGDKMAKLKDVLEQAKEVNSDLQSQYDKLAQAKASLEANLKSALEEKQAAAQAAVQAAEVAQTASAPEAK